MCSVSTEDPFVFKKVRNSMHALMRIKVLTEQLSPAFQLLRRRTIKLITGLISEPVRAGASAQFVRIIRNFFNNTAFIAHRNSEPARHRVQARVPKTVSYSLLCSAFL